MKEDIHQSSEYDAGYYSCEAGLLLDETKSDMFKKGYRDKEKERLIRSVKYHLNFVSGKVDCCHYLIENNSNGIGTEYQCYYYGKTGNCKCYDKILQDFLRLYADE